MGDDIGKAVASLEKNYDLENLLEVLAARTEAITRQPHLAGQLEPDVTIPFETMGPGKLKKLGWRLLQRFEREMHGLVCGDDEADEEERTRILGALTLEGAGLGAVVAGVLISSFGVAPAVAAVVAALLIKRIIKPGQEELCVVWKERLDDTKPEAALER